MMRSGLCVSQQRQGVATVGRFQNLAGRQGRQQTHEAGPHQGVIVNEQDGHAARPSASSSAAVAGSRAVTHQPSGPGVTLR